VSTDSCRRLKHADGLGSITAARAKDNLLLMAVTLAPSVGSVPAKAAAALMASVALPVRKDGTGAGAPTAAPGAAASATTGASGGQGCWVLHPHFRTPIHACLNCSRILCLSLHKLSQPPHLVLADAALRLLSRRLSDIAVRKPRLEAARDDFTMFVL
jgi:hypothetical protein